MGSSQSSANQTAISNAISTATYNSISKYTYSAAITQSQIAAGGSSIIGSSQKAALQFDLTQMQTSEDMNTIQNQISSAFGQMASSSTAFSLLQFANTSSQQNIENNIQSTCNANFVMTTCANFNESQTQIAAGGSMLLFDTQDASMKAFLTINNQALNKGAMGTAITNAAAQMSEAQTQNPLSFLDTLVSDLMSPFEDLIYIIIGVIALIFIAVAWSIFGGSKPQQPQPHYQQGYAPPGYPQGPYPHPPIGTPGGPMQPQQFGGPMQPQQFAYQQPQGFYLATQPAGFQMGYSQAAMPMPPPQFGAPAPQPPTPTAVQVR